MSEPTQEEFEEDVFLPISPDAHASASLGLTIVVGGRSHWPKYEFGDNALPGETAADLQARVLEACIDGAFTLAENAKFVAAEVAKPANTPKGT